MHLTLWVALHIIEVSAVWVSSIIYETKHSSYQSYGNVFCENRLRTPAMHTKPMPLSRCDRAGVVEKNDAENDTDNSINVRAGWAG